MAARWGEADSQRLRELHATGMALHSIAKEMGRSKDTVSRYARKLGLGWDREKTAKAAQAVHLDNRAMRVLIEQKLLAQTLTELEALNAEARVYSFGGAENVYREEWLERPPPSDRRSIAQTVATMTTAANRLHELNSAREADGVKATLTRLREALTDRARDSADQ